MSSAPGFPLKTNLFIKPTDTRQYLHYSSYQPSSHKNGTPFSQALRINRICSDPNDRDLHLSALKEDFRCRGYPEHTLLRVDDAARLSRDHLLQPKRRSEVPLACVPLVLDYHESWQHVSSIVRDLLPILADLPVKIPVYWRAPRKIRNILIRARLSGSRSQPSKSSMQNTRAPLDDSRPSTIQLSLSWRKRQLEATDDPESALPDAKRFHLDLRAPKNGTYRCLRGGCKTCPFIQAGSSFVSYSTNFRYQTRGRFDCTSSNVIYLISCTNCMRQYVGETGGALSIRFNNHRSSCNRPESNPTPVSCHVNSYKFIPPVKGSFSGSYAPIPTNTSRCNISHLKLQIISSAGDKNNRKRTEMYYISQLKTDLPYGLNYFHSLNSFIPDM